MAEKIRVTKESDIKKDRVKSGNRHFLMVDDKAIRKYESTDFIMNYDIDHSAYESININGAIKDISSKKDKEDVKFYRLILMDNCVLMSLGEGRYVMINEYIYDKKGKRHEIVEILKNHNIYVDYKDSGRGRIRVQVKWGELPDGRDAYKLVYLERLLISIREYGDISSAIDIDSNLEVHHLRYNYDLRIENLVLLTSEEHKREHRMERNRGERLNRIPSTHIKAENAKEEKNKLIEYMKKHKQVINDRNYKIS